MPHDYLEESRKSGWQKRWACDECHREFVWATPDAFNEKNCPACGSESVHEIVFKGLFDSTTDPSEEMRVFDVATLEQLAREDEQRSTRVGIQEAFDPPAVLVGAGSGSGWAPEFD